MKNLVMLFASVLLFSIVRAQEPNFSYFDVPLSNADPSQVLIYKISSDLHEIQVISGDSSMNGVYNLNIEATSIVDKRMIPEDVFMAKSSYGNGTIVSDSVIGDILLTAYHVGALIYDSPNFDKTREPYVNRGVDLLAIPLKSECVNGSAELSIRQPQSGDCVTWSSFELNDKDQMVWRTASGQISIYNDSLKEEMKITRKELKNYLEEQTKLFEISLSEDPTIGLVLYLAGVTPKQFLRSFAKMYRSEVKGWNKAIKQDKIKEFILVEIPWEYALESPGSSGSALLDSDGRVIGVLSSVGPVMGDWSPSPDGKYYALFAPIN